MRVERYAAPRSAMLPAESESAVVPLRGGACLLAIAHCGAVFFETGWAPASSLFLERLAKRLENEALASAAQGAFDDLCASDLMLSVADHPLYDPRATFAAGVIDGDRAVLAAVGGHHIRVVRDGAIVVATVPDAAFYRGKPKGLLVHTRVLRPDWDDSIGTTEVLLAPGDEVQVLSHGMTDLPRSDADAEALRRELDMGRVLALVASI